ncbi:MAG: rhodanese-like domain-containing protein [Prochloraceae cyanobacterium]|nr:rhodanese-like domain-containing protein [Prochloraceae cyanobacterium]
MSILFELIPSAVPLKPRARVYDLKSRLDWGKPALTIIDARDREKFNASHILGAITMPVSQLVERALSSLELTRDIYVYGVTDEETSVAAAKLREAGYKNVSEIIGGLGAWRAVGYPIESNTAAIGYGH